MAFANKREVAVVTGGQIAAHLVMGEVPAGAVDGINAVFTTASTVILSSIDVFLDGMCQQSGAGKDYVFSLGNTITFSSAPHADAIILVDYIK